MWIAAGAVVVVLLVIWGAYAVGKRQGKTGEQKEDAEQKAEDMAYDAAVAAKPYVPDPFGSMHPKG